MSESLLSSVPRSEAVPALAESIASALHSHDDIIHTASSGYAHISAPGEWLYVNPRFADILGYRTDEVLLLDPAALEHPGHTSWGEFHAAAEAGDRKPRHFETRLLRCNGTAAWVDVHSWVLSEAAGASAVLMIEDITERKQLEQRLTAEYAVSQVLGEADGGEYDRRKVLEAIGSNLGWDAGLFWRVDRERNVLCCADYWRADTAPNDTFEEISCSTTVPIGEGALSTALSTGEVAFVDELPEHASNARDAAAAAAGFKSTLAFPLFRDAMPVGVMEFFSTSTARVDEDLLRTMSLIGHELCVFTTRLHAERSARESDERYRRLAEAAFEGIVMHDQGVVLDTNESFARMFGFEVHEIIGRNVLELVANAESAAEIMERVRTDYEQPYEVVGRRRDGTPLPVEITGRRTMYNGRSVRVAAIRDLTQRRQIEEQAVELVREQAARAHAEAEQKRTALLSEASRVLGSSFDYNTTLAQLARIAVPDMADWCVVNGMDADDRVIPLGMAHVDPAQEAFLANMAERRSGQPSNKHPVSRVIQNGTPLFLPVVSPEDLAAFALDSDYLEDLQKLAPRSAMVVPVMVQNQVFGALTLVISDTERAYTTDDLALAEELARRAALAIQNARLFDEAQRATKARDEMLGVVAHDLRNPLNTIVMGADLLLELLAETNDALPRRQVLTVRRAADRMNRLIQDLLDVRRIDSGGLVIEPHLEPPETLVCDAVEMLSPLADAASIRLKTEVASGLPKVLVDAPRFQQVLSNLVGNAIKFTPAGGQITLRTQAGDDHVQFAVIDTGPGIAPEHLPHIFRRFFQGDRADRRGIGLGLSIAQSIVEKHGGRIWVESQFGEGSTFLFTIPSGI